MLETNKRPKNIAIIFAGGSGTRMGAEMPKQFLQVCGKEIIIHTLEAFQKHPEIDEIYIGCKEDWIPYLAQLVINYGITKVPDGGILPGGVEGQDTIYKVLKRARENNTDDDIVLINDGVRPNITDLEISLNIRSVIERGSTMTCTKFTSTPVYSEDGIVLTRTLPREKMFCGVAPQSFRLGHILEAHETIRKISPNYKGEFNGTTIVDSATLVQAAFNERCYMIEGNPSNMKVTTMGDFFALLGLIQSRDIYNYFMVQNGDSFHPNSAFQYSQQEEEFHIDDQAKRKILGGNNGNK